MTQNLAYAESTFNENTSMETLLATTDDGETGYVVEVDFKCPGRIKQNNKYFTSLSGIYSTR